MELNLDLSDLETSTEEKRLQEFELKRIEYEKIQLYKKLASKYIEQLELVPLTSEKS